MIKRLSMLLLVAAISACSSDSNNTSTNGGVGGNGNGNGSGSGSGSESELNNGGNGAGGEGFVSGGLPGVWVGNNDFGEGVMIIDAGNNVYALTRNTSGRYEAMFGALSGELDRFIHRPSYNTDTATSFTVAGDSPSTLEVQFIDTTASDTSSYSLTVVNEGQQINNAATSTATAFNMMLADFNDMPAMDLSDVVGEWKAQTSYLCGTVCELGLEVNINASGKVSGGTIFNDVSIPLNGTVSAVAEASQYLSIEFTWNGLDRSGVLYWDRNDRTRLIMNTAGPDGDGVKSFSATLTRQ